MQKSGIQFVIEDTAFDRVIDKASAADDALASVVDRADAVDAALSSVGDVEVSVDVETNVDNLDTLQTDLEAFADSDYEATASIAPEDTDFQTLEGELDSFDTETAEAEALVAPEDTDFQTLQGDLETFDQEAVDAEATAQVERAALDTLETDIGELDQKQVEPQINAVVTGKEDVDSVSTSVKTIALNAGKAALGLAAIVAAVGGGALAMAAKSFLSMDSALDSIEAKTGRLIPGTEELITNLYQQGFADSRDEIADLIIQMDHLQISQKSWGEAAQSAFQTAEVTGKPVSDILNTMQRLVSTNLSESFTSAGDTMVAGFQEGGDRAGDLFSALEQNADVLKDMGFDANTATQTIINGLDGGVDSANEVINTLTTLRGRLSDNSKEVQDTLDNLDLTDETDAYLNGQKTGEEFLRGLTEALDKIEDPAARLEATNTLFGRQARGFGADAIAGLGKIGTAMDDVAGRAKTADDVIKRDFGESLEKTFRTLEGRVIEFLSSDQVDLPGKLETLESQLQTFIDNVQAGKSIAQSIDLAFQLEPGTFEEIESVFNNFLIGFMQSIQSILQIVPGQEAAAKALGDTIAGFASGQFQFDLKLANNGEDLKTSIQTALDRGVSAADIGAALTESVTDQLARGDLLGANQTLDAIKEMATVPITIGGIEFAPGTSREQIENDPIFTMGVQDKNGRFSKDELQRQLDEAFAAPLDTTELEDNARILGEIYRDKLTEAIAQGDYTPETLDLAKQVGTPEEIDAIQALVDMQDALQVANEETATSTESTSARTTTAMDDARTSVETYTHDTDTNLQANVDAFTEWESQVNPIIHKVDLSVDKLAGKIGSLNAQIATLGDTPIPEGTSTAPPPPEPHAEGGTAYGLSKVGERGTELVDFPYRAGIINAANSSVLMRALESLRISGGGGSTVNNYINVSNIANTQSIAQADAFGYRIGRQVRGFGQ